MAASKFKQILFDIKQANTAWLLVYMFFSLFVWIFFTFFYSLSSSHKQLIFQNNNRVKLPSSFKPLLVLILFVVLKSVYFYRAHPRLAFYSFFLLFHRHPLLVIWLQNRHNRFLFASSLFLYSLPSRFLVSHSRISFLSPSSFIPFSRPFSRPFFFQQESLSILHSILK